MQKSFISGLLQLVLVVSIDALDKFPEIICDFPNRNTANSAICFLLPSSTAVKITFSWNTVVEILNST